MQVPVGVARSVAMSVVQVPVGAHSTATVSCASACRCQTLTLQLSESSSSVDSVDTRCPLIVTANASAGADTACMRMHMVCARHQRSRQSIRSSTCTFSSFQRLLQSAAAGDAEQQCRCRARFLNQKLAVVEGTEAGTEACSGCCNHYTWPQPL